MGGALRSVFCEDVACAVEDFLFSRHFRHRGLPSSDDLYRTGYMLYNCVLEDDYDGIVYILVTFPHSCWYGSNSRLVFGSIQSAHSLNLLLSFGLPSGPDPVGVHQAFLYHAACGRTSLVQHFWQKLTIPRDVLDKVIAELRGTGPASFLCAFHMTRAREFCEEEGCVARRQCLTFLEGCRRQY